MWNKFQLLGGFLVKGSETSLAIYMEGSTKRFIIPVYQRNYDWKMENCRQLYDDLVKVVKQKRKKHFFGSIVSVYENSGKTIEFLIIDGQQRLTTVSLLLLAMYNLVTSGIVKSEDNRLQERIHDEFLVDKYQPKEKRIKLKAVKNDRNAFGKLFEDESEYIKDSNITANYNYFYERIQKNEITIDELFDAIYRLEIISITLDKEDDPQLIFESLNSTGLDLSEGDKIRNYILMGLPKDVQEDYYEKYWNKIEVCTGYDVSSFARDYLSVKKLAIPAQKKVYFYFKEYMENSQMSTEELLQDLLAYAKRYEYLLGLKKIAGSDDFNYCVYRLNRLETTVTRPFFLEALRMYEIGKLDLNKLTDIFQITESFIFRRTICDLPTNALNKIFLLLHREIIRFDGTEENYFEKFKYALISKKEKVRFPSDIEFISRFTEKQVYQMNGKNKIYILERFENYGTKENKDVYNSCDNGKYTIEHIMPQHLTSIWVKELGKDYKDIHDTWLHRLANLTLTAYNSQYSNNSFDDKKNRKDGFIQSGIRMNTSFVALQDKWTLEELEKRNKLLMDKALEIWCWPATSFKPVVKQLDMCSLADDEELTGRNIYGFSYKNNEQTVKNWSEMAQRVLQNLYSEDKSIIKSLAKDSYNSLSSSFSYKEQDFSASVEVADGIYFNTNSNTSTKLAILRELFKLYSIENDALVFYLKNNNYNVETDSVEDKLIRYWSVALPKIKESFGENAPFCNVSAKARRNLMGTIGLGNAGVVCGVKNNGIKVELYFGISDSTKNKMYYDFLFQHKNEIEQKLGAVLSWHRRDNEKGSMIYIDMNGLSFMNEEDWPSMVNFHVEWSKKLYDIMIAPYLLNK